MNVTTSGLRIVLLALALVVALAPASARAQAADPRQPVALAVAGPDDVPLGSPARFIAVLRDGSGQPIARARIVFTSPASFAGAVGEMALGDVPTDKEGVAILDYRLSIQGQNQVIARFHGDATYQPAQAATVTVATGQQQLVQRSAGLQIPWLGPGTLILVLGAVWVVYLLALLLVAGIPERSAAQAIQEGGR